MFPLNGHNVTWPQHRRASMSNSRQLWVNPHQFGLEGSDWIHNNELLVRLRTSLGLPSEGVLKMSPKIPHWGCSLNVFVIVLVFVFVVVFLLVRSCILIALIKCLKGQKSHLVELLVSTALKDLSYIWTIYSTWRALSNPSVPCQALTKMWWNTNYKCFKRWKWFHWSHISSIFLWFISIRGLLWNIVILI